MPDIGRLFLAGFLILVGVMYILAGGALSIIAGICAILAAIFLLVRPTRV